MPVWNSSATFDFPAWSISQQQQSGLLIVATVLAIAAGIYAIWFSWRQKDAYPFFVFLGAGVSVLYEPLGDILTKVAYPPVDQVSLMTAFGRPTPLWLAPNYFFFFCVPVLLLLQFVVRENVTAKKWWLSFFGLVLFVGVFEQPGINAQSWRYYGVQAFSINTYPVWVAFANAQTLFLIAVGVFCLRRSVIPAKLSFLFVLLIPTLVVAAHVGSTLFVVSAIYSTTNLVLVNAAAALTIFVCCLNIWIGLRLVQRQGAIASTA